MRGGIDIITDTQTKSCLNVHQVIFDYSTLKHINVNTQLYRHKQNSDFECRHLGRFYIIKENFYLYN